MDIIVIWNECSLGRPLLDTLKKIDLTKNMAATGGANFHYITYSETSKNLLLHNASMDFIIIWHECFLGGPLLESLKKF